MTTPRLNSDMRWISLSPREEQEAQMALEFAYGVPFDALVAGLVAPSLDARSTLLAVGSQLFEDLARLARGDLYHVTVPRLLSSSVAH